MQQTTIHVIQAKSSPLMRHSHRCVVCSPLIAGVYRLNVPYPIILSKFMFEELHAQDFAVHC